MLPTFAVDMLNEHRKAQLELRIQLGMGKPDDRGYGVLQSRRHAHQRLTISRSCGVGR